MPKIIFLWTDIALFALVATVLVYAGHVARSHALRATWSKVARSATAMSSAVILMAFVVVFSISYITLYRYLVLFRMPRWLVMQKKRRP